MNCAENKKNRNPVSLYFDCSSGISGDMVVASLLDAGASKDKLMRGLESLGLDHVSLGVEPVSKNGVDALQFRVEICRPSLAERNLDDIHAVIERADISPRARELSKKIFGIAALSQATAHGCRVDEVLFHEKGAVDSLLDIVGTAVCIDDLRPVSIGASPLSEGTGHTRWKDMVFPVPAPAVRETVSRFSLPVRYTDIRQELITPTGAAIAAALFEMFHSAPPNPLRVGIGAGTREYGRGGVLKCLVLPH